MISQCNIKAHYDITDKYTILKMISQCNIKAHYDITDKYTILKMISQCDVKHIMTLPINRTCKF